MCGFLSLGLLPRIWRITKVVSVAGLVSEAMESLGIRSGFQEPGANPPSTNPSPIACQLELLAPAPGHPLPGAIEPMAFEGHAVDQGAGRMNPRPFQRTFAKPLFDTMLEEVAQSRPLHLGLVADDDSIVATRP